ncbi:DUF1772 domain-containing protein [Danxiaibacter flavus]|uniref:DUF1772 domain-containing protein n=1 Tax=Danxiaibacter flavus TaxID=3049108 RepID=A0ABV3ZK68_9BACT|nr:DUF1772 domain-containing protein [Chitinophagaceae bacterium DXS]
MAMFTLIDIVLLLTTVVSSLAGGLFYAWSCSVIPGLKKLPDNSYIEAMQSFNRAILNPAFFVSFTGTLLLLPLCVYLSYDQQLSARFYLLLASLVLYVVGVFGITALGNIPLNKKLDNFNWRIATEQSISLQRRNFEGPWIRLHSVRTYSGILVIVLEVIACLMH